MVFCLEVIRPLILRINENIDQNNNKNNFKNAQNMSGQGPIGKVLTEY